MIQFINQTFQYSYYTNLALCTALSIETAIRTIYHTGSLFHNLYEKNRIQKTVAVRPFYPLSLEGEEKGHILDRLITTVKENITNKKLSCQVKENETVIALKVENSELTCQLNLENFKLSCSTYRDMCDGIGDEFTEYTIPNCSVAGFQLLTTYLLDPSKFSMENLSQNTLFDFYRLATFLGIPHLEKYCIFQIVNHIISSKIESIDAISDSISEDYKQYLKILIWEVRTENINKLNAKIEENKIAIPINFLATVILGVSILNPHPIITTVSFITFFTFIGTFSGISPNKNLLVWSLHRSFTLIAENSKHILESVVSKVVQVTRSLLEKPVIGFPLFCIGVIGTGYFAGRLLVYGACETISAIANHVLPAIPTVANTFLSASLKLIPTIASLSFKVTITAFDVLTFVPRKILNL